MKALSPFNNKTTYGDSKQKKKQNNNNNNKKMDEDWRDLRRKAGPLGTEGTAWDVGWAVVYLASDEAKWITGVVLPVDAGVQAASPLSMWDDLNEAGGPRKNNEY